MKNINFNLFNVNKVHFGFRQAQNLNKKFYKEKNTKSFYLLLIIFLKNKNILNKIKLKKNNRIFILITKMNPQHLV